jgi:hypothetical protein
MFANGAVGKADFTKAKILLNKRKSSRSIFGI